MSKLREKDILEKKRAALHRKMRRKNHRALRIILIALGSLIGLALIAAAAIFATLYFKFRTTSYEYQKPVERTTEYVMPEYPEVSLEPEEENPVESDEESEEKDDTEETDKSDEDEDQPAEDSQSGGESTLSAANGTLPSVVNPTSNPTTGYHSEYDRDASFSNSYAVSVYGSVPIYKVARKDENVQNILLVGTDSRDVSLDRGRSDTMIVVSYNKSNGSIKLTSLLRDTLAPIEGHGWNRLNAAYAFGGIGLTLNTINQTFDLDIQDFIIIDFNGVRDFIDYIGGVDLYLTAEEANYYNNMFPGKNLTQGMNHLDRGLALAHMRNRKLGTDYGRTRRQRDTITAVAKKIISEKSLTDIYSITDYVFSIIKTNMSASSLLSFATSAYSQGSGISIQSENVPFSDAYQFAWYNGLDIISYDIPSTAARLNRFIYEQ